MERAKDKPRETPAVKGLLSLNRKVKLSLLTKIRNIHAVCKMGRPFKDFLYMCDLDRAKGMDIGFTYCNATRCMALLDAVVAPIKQETVSMLDKTKFFSLTVDGSTDLAGIEQESLYIRSCSSGVVTQRMLCVGQAESSGAADIHSFILQSMEKYNISQFFFKLVGFGSDGAANMQGIKTGVGKRLQENHPELVLVKCLAHRLESSFKDAMKKTPIYDKLQTLLLGLYYMYKRSPKERQRLMKTFSALEMSPLLPPRIGGTRWLPHVDHAINVFVWSYRALVTQLQDASGQSNNAKCEGLAKAAMSVVMIVFILELQVIW